MDLCRRNLIKQLTISTLILIILQWGNARRFGYKDAKEIESIEL